MTASTPTSSYTGGLWFVRSAKAQALFYTVSTDPASGLYRCECPDHRHRGRDCKHIKVVQAGGGLPARAKAATAPALARPARPLVDLWGDGGEGLDRAVQRLRAVAR